VEDVPLSSPIHTPARAQLFISSRTDLSNFRAAARRLVEYGGWVFRPTPAEMLALWDVSDQTTVEIGRQRSPASPVGSAIPSRLIPHKLVNRALN
jgi:hypothetical protein